MKKRRISQRLLACLLGIVLTVLTCACASVDAPSKDDDALKDSKQTAVLELSGVNVERTASNAGASDSDEQISADDEATLSEDVTITPIEPIVPEERETTLEKVLSFDIGIDGLFQYSFIFYDDPSSAMMTNPGRIHTDGKGTFYYQWASDLLRLNDGVWFRTGANYHIEDVAFLNNDLYLLFTNGTVEQYDISESFETPALKNTYQVYDNFMGSAALHSIGDAEPIVLVRDKLEEDVFGLYTLSKESLTGKDAPFVVQDGIQSVTVENGLLAIPTQENGCYVCSITEGGIWTIPSISSQRAYTMYAKDGSAVARVLFEQLLFEEDVRLDVEFEHAGKIYTKEYGRLYAITFGDSKFEGLVSHGIFFDQYGTAYLAVYYTDHCDVYCVDAGYTSANF